MTLKQSKYGWSLTCLDDLAYSDRQGYIWHFAIKFIFRPFHNENIRVGCMLKLAQEHGCKQWGYSENSVWLSCDLS